MSHGGEQSPQRLEKAEEANQLKTVYLTLEVNA